MTAARCMQDDVMCMRDVCKNDAVTCLHLHLQKNLGEAVCHCCCGAFELRIKRARNAAAAAADAAAAAARYASDTAATNAHDVLVQHVEFAVVVCLRGDYGLDCSEWGGSMLVMMLLVLLWLL